MKLLFVHQYLGALGGAENTLVLTASELKARGHQVGLLYCRPTGKGEEAWTNSFGKHLFRIASPGNLEHTEAVIDEFSPDVIFVHNFSDSGVFEALLGAGAPVVRMVHDHSLYCLREYKYNYFTRAVCQRPASGHCVFPCMATIVRDRQGRFPVKFASYAEKLREISVNRRCDRFFVYSDYCRQELIRNGFDGTRVHLYVPIRFPEESPVSSFSERNLVIFAGQIIRGKGVDVLLKALRKVRSHFECLVMGDGSHREHCERLSRKLDLQNKVRFTGFLPPETMRAHYAEASVFAVSSVWPEPFGLVGPEAMRFGLPVVAFDAGGIREWLHDGENGFLVPWMNTDAYAEALETLLENKSLARAMGACGKQRAASDYNLDVQVNRLEEVFTGLSKGPTKINENAGVNVVHGNG